MTYAEIERFVDAMLRGDVAEMSRPENGAVAAEVATVYVSSSLRTPQGRRGAARLAKEQSGAVLDLIMERGHTGESLEMSLARVARAAGAMGFERLDGFAALAAYETFPQLSKELKHGKRKATGECAGQDDGRGRRGDEPAGGRGA